MPSGTNINNLSIYIKELIKLHDKFNVIYTCYVIMLLINTMAYKLRTRKSNKYRWQNYV